LGAYDCRRHVGSEIHQDLAKIAAKQSSIKSIFGKTQTPTAGHLLLMLCHTWSENHALEMLGVVNMARSVLDLTEEASKTTSLK